MTVYNQAPEIKVGILNASEIRIKLNGLFISDGLEKITGDVEFVYHNGRVEMHIPDSKPVYDNILLKPADFQNSSFTVFGVTIGIGFHWQKKEDQVFRGSILVMPHDGKITLVNILPVEEYLVSVISSEMKATSSAEMLKAHAVISRSWLLAQIKKKNEIRIKDRDYNTSFRTDDELIRWYDREDHIGFDVCADDHCQRYQGITRAFTDAASKAVYDTAGEVLMHNDSLCDARFSKCCGGITELFENAWEPLPHAYLQRVYDFDNSAEDVSGDLTREHKAKEWILSSPPAFCNTADKEILSQVLNDYDQTTRNFYRWTVSYSREELSELVHGKTGIDFGDILGLTPIERGVSGRITRLRIKGSKKSMIIGKELEIRKALSKTHLYSSAFIPEKINNEGGSVTFVLHGAGWGHGVGLCQIGAAVMGARGYKYEEILGHYFRGAELIKLY